jgi:NAD(P)-dependent dehydrogenase (short-subunit alcohol dehydrogenase family)
MADTSKTVIVTGGSQGIGSGAVRAFLDRDYNVVATSRHVTKSKDLLLPQEWRKQLSAHSARLMH